MLAAAVLWIWLALWVLGCLLAVERPAAVGLRRLSLRQTVTATAAVFCLAYVPMWLLHLGWCGLAQLWPSLVTHSGTESVSALPAELVCAVAAGFSEEIIVVVLPVLLALRVRSRVTSAHLRRVGVVALVLGGVVLRCSYHLMYGMHVLVLVPWAAISVWLYLRTRAVVPLVIAHALYDGWVACARSDPSAARTLGGFVALAGVAAVVAVCTRRVDDLGPGARRRLAPEI